jgi:hypothetical protein
MLAHRFGTNGATRRWHVAVLAVVALLAATTASAEPRLTVVSGEVEIGRGEPPVWRVARTGDALGPGDRVRTGGGGRAEVDLGGALARLYENSLLRLPDGGAVGLERGGSLFDVTPRTPADPFEVRTPEVVASVKGTRFAVLVAEAGAAVNVYEGLVGVRRGALETTREVLVREGFGAVGAGGSSSFELRLLPAADPWQGWSEGAPAPPLPSALSRSARIDEARALARRAVDPVLAARSGLGQDGDKASAAPSAPPASLDDAAVEATPERSPLDPQVGDRDQALPPEMQTELAESLLNGTAPAIEAALPTNSTSDLLSIELVKSGGPNHVVISDPVGPVVDLTVDQVETILDTGDTSLLGQPVLDTLSEVGVDPETFTQQLRGILD